MTLKGRIAFVTGASRGIGRAIAWRLAGAECDLVLLARSRDQLSALAMEIKTAGREAMAVVADLRDAPQVERAVAKALAYFGRIDILVNNAGLWHYALAHEQSLEEWDEMFDVNLRGAFVATRSILPSMLERGSGHIVNIASVSGLIGEAEGAGYCATKWGLRGFTYSLYKELAPRGIRVSLINPGVVNNENENTLEASRLIQCPDVAELVYQALVLPPRANLVEATLFESGGIY